MLKFTDQTAGQILRHNWKSLIPLMFLIAVVLLRTVPIPPGGEMKFRSNLFKGLRVLRAEP